MKTAGTQDSGNVQKVMFLLEELRLPYEREDYGRQFNNTQTPEYLALNPNAKVPTLVDGDMVDLGIQHASCATSPRRRRATSIPTEVAERSQVERWMDWQLSALNNPYLAMFRESKLEPAKRSADFDTQRKDLGTQLSILDRALGSGYVAGAEFSIADICLAPIVSRCLKFGVELPELPNVKRWDAALSQREAFKKATAA